MQIKNYLIAIAALGSIVLVSSCNKLENESPSQSPTPAETAGRPSADLLTSEDGNNPDDLALLRPANKSNGESYLYTESNKRSTNTIIQFTQKKDGSLQDRNEFTSGGYGNGEGLGSQGALAVSKEMGLLFAVNAGSGSISSFRIKNNGSLQLLFTTNTYGVLPNSLTIHGNTLYVLNNISSTICGFTVEPNGFFTKIEGSVHSLSALNVDAPQIGFQPDGKALFVTEKETNIINKFLVDNNGNITAATQITSYGITPFGFDFSRDKQYLIVSNAANGFSGAGSCSSYKDDHNGGLTSINGAADFQSAPCWVATTEFGSYAYVTNTMSDRISSFYIDKSGALTLLKSVAGENGKDPIDIVVSADNNYVYNINSTSHTISEYKRMPAGVIEYIGKVTTLPDNSTGLVSY